MDSILYDNVQRQKSKTDANALCHIPYEMHFFDINNKYMLFTIENPQISHTLKNQMNLAKLKG